MPSMNTDAPSQADGKLRGSKAGTRKRQKNKAARKRKAMARAATPYQNASRGSSGRVRTNRKAERFDVDEGRGWLVLRAEAGRYAQCAEVLRSAGCPVFEARREVRTTVQGQVKVTRPPMMGRLLFVGVEQPEFACLLTDLQYVDRVLCRGEGVWFWADHVGIQDARPAIIRPLAMQKFADNITGHLKGEAAVGDFVEALFAVGDSVRVVDGPFASFRGTVEELDVARSRLKVAAAIFGRETPLWLEEKQVEAAEAA